MPKKVLDEDKLRRKKALEEKRAARRLAKKEEERHVAVPATANDSSIANKNTENKEEDGGNGNRAGGEVEKAEEKPTSCMLLQLPEDGMRLIYVMLTAADLGRLAGTCKALTMLLSETRTFVVKARCCRVDAVCSGRVRFMEMCTNEVDAENLLKDSYGGGDTGRIVPRNRFPKKQQPHLEFCAFARYLEEAATGISYLSTGAREPIQLPRFVQGRIASISPEHTLCRVGGDGEKCGGGGSGLASWGVGRRGQLGHGKRQDERLPRRLMGGIGYGIRIVQCSAGGGLVRVAHSLLLTNTGHVLSFGTGQYGALGHGYSAAKQLPDELRPRYIDALSGVRCVCVAAGELHSAVVTSDGDVYSWGDGFCGQLGHGDRRPRVVPKQVTSGNLEDESITNVSCGGRHTIAVTEEGEVFTWGLGHFGVLGRSFTPFDHDAVAALVGVQDEEVEAVVGVQQPLPPPIPPAHPVAVPNNEAGGWAAGEGNIDAELRAQLDLIGNLSLDDSSDQCLPRLVESLKGVRIVGSSAGHRHSLLLDEVGSLYSCGLSLGGCLGHGDTATQMYPMKITHFEDEGVRIVQMSAGVDISMAVSSTGNTYAWGKTAGGRIGLGPQASEVTMPRKVEISYPDGRPFKAVDVECGYVHSIIVGLDGTIHMCGGVGVEGEADGQVLDNDDEADSQWTKQDSKNGNRDRRGLPVEVEDFNVWHRLPEPKDDVVKKEKWKKYGKYEVRGRSKMVEDDTA
ncbi:hypothetical protein ACA910_009989 [Epithemia clementina (nom. ined.)]